MTLVAALVIPAAMAIAILAISLFGETLNIMSVGGLAIAVGLIIDDAIVVVEGIARTVRTRRTSRRAKPSSRRCDRLVPPMTASTLATVVVFIPLSLLCGVRGAFFRALALTLSCALLVSLALALLRDAAALSRVVSGASEAASRHLRRARTSVTALRADPALGARHRAAVYRSACGVLIRHGRHCCVCFPSDFLPRARRRPVRDRIPMPVGTTLAASDAAATALERRSLPIRRCESEGRFTGIDTNGISPTPARAGIIRVRLQAARTRRLLRNGRRPAAPRAQLVVPAAQLDVHQILEDLIDDISGAPEPVEIVISGTDQATLARLADRVFARSAARSA